ncbi:MAG: riboflavin synthase [Candidatus Omnitrophica bacterium]|nr:riboflavin synthase [Candidatus Omnitrophota bacterium]
MFTGIIEEMGIVEKLDKQKNLCVLNIRVNRVLVGTKNGDSISINGVCLTVTGRKGKVLSFDLMRETLFATTLRDLKPGDAVNLERAMKADGRFGGHFVTGHIDGIGTIKNIVKLPNYVAFEVTLDKKFMRYLVAKGSVTLDGISLTVGQVKKETFIVHLIPMTLRLTNFGQKKKADCLNVETDILARYLLRK